MASDVTVRQATIEDVDALAALFDAYRRHYRQTPDVDGARRFLRERFAWQQSVVFLAVSAGEAVGFTQLYPGFSSVSMARIFVLNDLYVAPEARRRGTATRLLDAAAAFARRAGAARLLLETEVDNVTAQALYERLGWKRETKLCMYHLAL